VTVLTYHRVARYAGEPVKSQPDLTVEPARFVGTLAALHRAGFHTITQQQLLDALVHGVALPARPVMITVDDGYVDDVRQILPALRRFGFVATFYVITGRTHEPGFLTARQIRRLDAAGMDIGAHTRDHVGLTTIPAAAARREIEGSRSDLQRILGHPVYWFAYPYGSYDAAVEREVRAAGFLLAATLTETPRKPSSKDLLAIPRIQVTRATPESEVLALAAHQPG
jgi:peptidoglycan/xylan/chitin deacetylase (PgdA/CDA1 family)